MAHSQITISPYINGKFINIEKPERIFLNANPACPSDILSVTGWHRQLLPEIVDSLQSAQVSFARWSLAQRMSEVIKLARYLQQNSSELKSQMMLELGRSAQAVEEEWQLCTRLFNILPQFAQNVLMEQQASDGSRWEYAPVGLVLISNNVALPIYTLLSSLLPSLVAGNGVVLLPRNQCVLSVSILASCISYCDFPTGLIHVVHGDLEVYRKLILTHAFGTVFYTGGEESIEQIRKDLMHDPHTRMVFCSGGKNAALVMPSADKTLAIDQIVYGACVDAGQRLEATNLVFVHKSLVDEFSALLVQKIKAVPIGIDAAGTQTDQLGFMGPLCSLASQERFLRFQSMAARESSETLRWGKAIPHVTRGYFVSPGVHVLTAEQLIKSVYATNAFFGPDIAIVPIADIEQANSLLNKLHVSRSLTVHTHVAEEAYAVRQQSLVPTVLWNRPSTDLEPDLPVTGRGRAGNLMSSGLHFIYATVFPKVLQFPLQNTNLGSSMFPLVSKIASIFIACLLFLANQISLAQYQKAVEDNEVVKSKIYPKFGKFQVNLLQGGTVLNQSFLNTYLLTGSVTYHFNEWHAVNVEGMMGFSQDNAARICVESFYYNPQRAGALCSETQDPKYQPQEVSPPPPSEASKTPFWRKPAYMSIRQINQVFAANYQWTPVYGKQLFFLSATSYLDFYTSVGGGVVSSTYWPRKTTTRSGQDVRTQGTDDVNEFGKIGRPAFTNEFSPVVSLGIGNRFYFFKKFIINAEFRNFTVFGSDGAGQSDFMNFFALWGGLGMVL